MSEQEREGDGVMGTMLLVESGLWYATMTNGRVWRIRASDERLARIAADRMEFDMGKRATVARIVWVPVR